MILLKKQYLALSPMLFIINQQSFFSTPHFCLQRSTHWWFSHFHQMHKRSSWRIPYKNQLSTFISGIHKLVYKSVIIHSCSKYKYPKTHNIFLDLNQIPRFNTAKYFDITLDNNLSWNEHITLLRQNCFSKFNFLRKLAHTNFRSNNAAFFNLFDYSSSIYNITRPSTFDRLNTIQNSCIKIILADLCTIPAADLFSEASALEHSFPFRLSYQIVISFFFQTSDSYHIQFIPFYLQKLYTLHYKFQPPMARFCE